MDGCRSRNGFLCYSGCGSTPPIGEPLRHYIIRCRLRDAKRLLLNTDLHVTEIAYQVGLQDVKHFLKTFKQWESVTPSAYRQTHYRTHINTE